MEINLTPEEFKDNFTKLLSGLVESEDVTNFYVDKSRKNVQIMLNDWTLELKADGTWLVS